MPRLFKLVALFAGGVSQEVIVPSQGLTIGRSRDNDLVIDEPPVSRHHARIAVENNQLVFYDLGSTNGSFVNNTRCSQAVLKSGDIVQIGSTIIKVK